MATFTEIYYNGNEYKQMWLNGNLLWQKEAIDYSQYINLEEVASGDNDGEAMALSFTDYDGNESSYWAYFDRYGYYDGFSINIPIPQTINTEYVLIKGLIKSNKIPRLCNFTFEGNYDSSYYYEFEAIISVSKGIRFILVTGMSENAKLAVGNITIEPLVSATSEYAKLTKVANYPTINNITLESTLTDTAILKGTQFTITPTITPTNYGSDELVITYDENYLSMTDNTFTVLDTTTVGQQLDITYSSKLNPSVSATYSVTIRDFISIESISLTHTLESLTDVAIGTTFTVIPTVEPTSHDDELLVDYDTNYLSKDGDNYTVLSGASGQTVQVIYYSKNDNNVNAMLEFTVAEKSEFQSLDQWKADLVPLEWDGVYQDGTFNTNTTMTYDTTERSIKLLRNSTSSSEYSDKLRLKVGDNYSSIFDSTKFYKLSYKVRGNDTVDGETTWSGTGKYSSHIYDGNGYTYYKSSNPILSETEWREENYVVYGISLFQIDIQRGTNNWIEVKDIMYQSYDEVPSLPDIDIYKQTATEISIMDLYNKGFIRNSGDTSYTKYVVDTTNNYFGMKVTSSDKVNGMGVSIKLPVIKDYIMSGLAGHYPSISHTLSFGYNSFSVYGINNNNIKVSTTYDNTTVDNMKNVFIRMDAITDEELYKNYKYRRTLDGFVERILYCERNDIYKYGKDSFVKFYNLTFSEEQPMQSIELTHDIDDINNVTSSQFTVTPTITPRYYTMDDLEVIYDSTYLSTTDNLKFSLKEGCQGKTLSVTYRSKENNSISDTLTFTVSQDLEIGMDTIDFTQSTAPTLPSCMTLDGQGSSYYFKHGTYTTDVYGLVPNNSGKNSTTAYTRYKFVAPKDGALTFTYRCYAETNYDYLTVHVDTSTSQPSYDSSTNRVFTTKGVSSYQTTDGTASVNVTGGITYYIHIQYRKDGSSASGYDKGCIRKIKLL